MSRFNVGDVIRYGSGETALMKVECVSLNHGGAGDRYYGKQFFGTPIGAYDYQCMPASHNDLARWAREHK